MFHRAILRLRFLVPSPRPSSTSSSLLFSSQQSLLPRSSVIVSWFAIIVIVAIGCRNSRRRDIMAFWTSPEMTQRANDDYHMRRETTSRPSGILIFFPRNDSCRSPATIDNHVCGIHFEAVRPFDEEMHR